MAEHRKSRSIHHLNCTCRIFDVIDLNKNVGLSTIFGIKLSKVECWIEFHVQYSLFKRVRC